MKKLRKIGLAVLGSFLLAVAATGVYDVAVGQPIGTTTLALTPGSSTVAPAIRATGAPANISINLVPKGTGTVQIAGVPIVGSGGTFTSLNVNPGPLNVTGSIFATPGTAALKRVGGIVIGSDITDIGNTAAVTEDTLHSYTIAANTLANDGESIEFQVQGTTAANADTKLFRMRWGGTLLIASTAIAMNNVAWRMQCRVFRTGAATQKVWCMGEQGGPSTTGQAWNVGVGGGNSFNTAAEVLAGPVLFSSTCQSGAATANNCVARISNVKWYPVGQ